MIVNIHQRILRAPITQVGELIDGLSSPADSLWPKEHWPAMRFDRPLQVGAVGGHGPIRYVVESYQPGRSICFRFTAPRGFLGTHRFSVEKIAVDRMRLCHTIEMRVTGFARLSWPLVFRPLHDALLEDALTKAERYLSSAPVTGRKWSLWVRLLRWTLTRRRRSARH